ncbi:MAG: adenylate/guanylate cyclase domain-containing protein [Pseudomonadota bacterium]
MSVNSSFRRVEHHPASWWRRKHWWMERRGMRLWSGMVLFAYVTAHLFNHMLGLWSVELMEAWVRITNVVVRSAPGTVLLYGALLAHIVTSLLSVYSRRSLKMKASEWLQLALGIAIPFLLLTHIMGTRYAHEVYGIRDSYAFVLISTFVYDHVAGWMNAAGLVAAWLHGCIGMYFWARLKPWFTRLHVDIGLVFATLWPLLALGGYLSAGRAIIPLAQDGEYMGAYYERLNLPEGEFFAWLGEDISSTRWVIISVLLAFIIARLARSIIDRRRERVRIAYVDGPEIVETRGPSLLEISRMAGVPHASVCGGRGRCSTCRVRVVESDAPLAPPDENESRVLSRIRADRDVRLACQLHPQGKLRVMRLLPSDATLRTAARQESWSSGREQTVTVMFADLRNFTATAEKRLPFDVVYLINQFSRAMGEAVEREGGRIDKFLGDGFMAIFGIDTTPERGARSSVAAAAAMMSALQHLNERLESDLDKPLRIGIGLHTGSVILGDMGYGPSRGLTAIGDVVNTASRLEAATKTEGCVLCVSETTTGLAQVAPEASSRREIQVRGRDEPVVIYAIDDPSVLVPDIASPLPQTARHGEKQSLDVKEETAL